MVLNIAILTQMILILIISLQIVQRFTVLVLNMNNSIYQGLHSKKNNLHTFQVTNEDYKS